MKKFLLPLLIGICIPFVAAFLFVYLGGMPVATRSAPLPLEEYLANVALRHARRAARKLSSSIPPSPENLLAGAKIYRENCAICHGVPDGRESPIAAGMFPDPPQFFAEKEEHEEHDHDHDHTQHDHGGGGTYWVVKNGIRLTGMPGFEKNLSETELWQVTHFLTHSKPMTPEQKRELLR